MALISLVRLPLESMVTADGKPQAQTTLYLGVFRRLDSASRQVARGSKRPLPRCNFSDSIHRSLRQLLVRCVYSQPRAASGLGHTLCKRCADCGRESRGMDRRGVNECYVGHVYHLLFSHIKGR